MKKLLLALLVLAIALATGLRLRYGGGADFPGSFPVAAPLLDESALEVVAELPTPPGNIAVAADGRVFLTLHPEARPQLKVVELRNGEPQPFPSAAFQTGEGEPRYFRDVLSLRIDTQNRLWTLDNGGHGVHAGRLLAFDLGSGAVVHEYEFPRAIAGLGSHLNDFQVSPDGQFIYIAEASFFAQTPALVVYDIARRSARRLLEGHASVAPEKYTPVVQGRRMTAFGLVDIRPGVDSIALDTSGEWLYYAPVTSTRLYRVRAADLRNESLTDEALAQAVEPYAAKTMSDGLTMDTAGNIYLSDLEHDAIVLLKTPADTVSRAQREGVREAGDAAAPAPTSLRSDAVSRPHRSLQPLLRSQRLRWPDGFSFGPDGWLYLTCSSLHQVIGKPASSIAAHAPYQVFRFKPGYAGVPGH